MGVENNLDRHISLFVPGRLCLFGEHSDWAGGFMSQNSELVEGRAIVTGINQGIYADVTKSDEFRVSSFNYDGEKELFSCAMNTKILKEYAAKPSLFSYCCGVAAYMRENYNVSGINVDITKVTLPMKKGLSSSAAICCLIAKAFNEIYDLHISTRGIMQIAYRGELLTGSRCGRLDQACAYGEVPVLMHFNYTEIDVERIRVGKTLHWVIADLCAGKDTKKILAHLNRAYPFATNDVERCEQEALGADNHRIIASACAAIEEGNPEKLGQLMVEAQNIFDAKVAPACPEELTAPVLHSVLNDPEIQQWIYGAKGVGSQGDGTVQLLAKNKDCQRKLVDYLNTIRHMEAFSFDMNAGGKVRKAIIPIAGNGTRMFPETFFIKKAFLPVVDENGITKPVLLYMLEELVDAGIEDIYLIVGENEIEEYQRIFHFEFDEQYESKLPQTVRAYYRKIYEIGKNVYFVVQREKKGFGHAVYQARKYLSGEPVLLMLGDFIYKSNLSISCTRQTINAYNKSGGKNVVAIKKILIEDASNYGIVHGTFSDERPYIMKADNMVEKPDEREVKTSLLVDDCCYATFGQYVLDDAVFDYLEAQIEEVDEHITKGEPWKEIDLTNALKNQAKQGQMVGVYIDGNSYDVGIPRMYYNTFNEFGKQFGE